jgi:hypothetical protein
VNYKWTLSYLLGLCLSAAHAAPAGPPRPQPAKPVVAPALAGPLKDVQEVVFAVRGAYTDGHWMPTSATTART